MGDCEETTAFLHIEVCQKSGSYMEAQTIENELEAYLIRQTEVPLDTLLYDTLLPNDIKYVRCCSEDVKTLKNCCPRDLKRIYHIYQNWHDEPGLDFLSDGKNEISNSLIWTLPNIAFEGLWESLKFNDFYVKKRLISYVETTLLYSSKKVNSQLVHWNGIILLHGAPGTGKTSLCKALAQKIAIRLDSKYNNCQLIEVNTHSLFSKWFSESPKLVIKMFESLMEKAQTDNNFFCVLIDEVESLTLVRQGRDSDPSDSVRVVNAVLTQIDRLQRHPNILIMATSNMFNVIDLAFADRADLTLYIPYPSTWSVYEIIKSCIEELIRCGLVVGNENDFFDACIYEKIKSSEHTEDVMTEVMKNSEQLLKVSELCDTISGRSIRKFPFLTSAKFINKGIPNINQFLTAMENVIKSN